MSDRQMSPRPMTDDAFDDLMASWLHDRADGTDEEAVLDAALARTARRRPRPGWSLPERWIPMELTTRLRPAPRPYAFLAIVALLVLAVAVALLVAGSSRHLPAPFGLAANGKLAFVQAGQIYTSDYPGAIPRPVTTGAATYDRPVFSRDGSRIAYQHFSDIEAQRGDVIVADADGSNSMVLDSGISPIGSI